MRVFLTILIVEVKILIICFTNYLFHLRNSKEVRQKTKKANVKFLGAVLKYILTHAPLNWNGL